MKLCKLFMLCSLVLSGYGTSHALSPLSSPATPVVQSVADEQLPLAVSPTQPVSFQPMSGIRKEVWWTVIGVAMLDIGCLLWYRRKRQARRQPTDDEEQPLLWGGDAQAPDEQAALHQPATNQVDSSSYRLGADAQANRSSLLLPHSR
ncbi:MAG: hypothetical protein KF832_23355 [Caldilineaceae bacterium]|nr:hypothetical protein [Caldilineaceae bacterium]